jgi:hypothetical protein
MITWNDTNPFDAVSVPACFEIEMDNGGNVFTLTMKGYGTIANASSKERAKQRAQDFVDALDGLPRVFKPA